MTTDSTPAAEDTNLFLGAAWFDPIEAGIRDQIRGFIEGMVEEELATLADPATYEVDPDTAWKRLKMRTQSGKFLAVARELARFRAGEPFQHAYDPDAAAKRASAAAAPSD